MYLLASPNTLGTDIDFSVNDFDPLLSDVCCVISLTLSRIATVSIETSPQSEQVDEDKKFKYKWEEEYQLTFIKNIDMERAC